MQPIDKKVSEVWKQLQTNQTFSKHRKQSG